MFHFCLFATQLSQVHIYLSAVRYCGITFGYTSIAILLNYSELNMILVPHSIPDRRTAYSDTSKRCWLCERNCSKHGKSCSMYWASGWWLCELEWLFFFWFCFTEANCTCQMWAMSITDNPSGYYLGFVVCAVVCCLSFLQSFLIR